MEHKMTEEEIDRLFNAYKSKGQIAAQKIQVKTLRELNEKKKFTQGQFFTPKKVAKFITELLGLDLPRLHLSVWDNSCGIGKLLRFVHEDNFILGTDIDEKAVKYANEIFSKLRNEESFSFSVKDLTNVKIYGDRQVDVALLNPPFNILLKRKYRIPLNYTLYSEEGPNTAIWSHIAALETAVKSNASIIATILPENALKNERDWAIDKILKGYYPIFKAKITNKEYFREEGAEVTPLITIFAKEYFKTAKTYDPEFENIPPAEKTETIKEDNDFQILKEKYAYLKTTAKYLKHREKIPIYAEKVIRLGLHAPKTKKKFIPFHIFSEGKDANLKITISSNRSRYIIKPTSFTGQIERAALLSILGNKGYAHFKPGEERENYIETISIFPFFTRFGEMIRNKKEFDSLLNLILSLNPTVEESFKNTLEERRKQYERENKYFEQWIFSDGTVNPKRIKKLPLTVKGTIYVSERYPYDGNTFSIEFNAYINKNPVTVGIIDEPSKELIKIAKENKDKEVDMQIELVKSFIQQDGTVIFKPRLISIPEYPEFNSAKIYEPEHEIVTSEDIKEILKEIYPPKEPKWIYNDQNSILKAYPALYEEIKKEVEETEIPLWEFQKRDVIRALMKPNAIIGAEMGLGKTRMFLAIANVLKRRGVKKILIVTEAKLASGYKKEAKKINFPYEIRIIRKAKDIPTDFSNVVCVIPYSILWRENNGIRFTKVFKKVNTLLVDELQNLKSPTTKQTKAVRKIKAKRKILASGTPIKNYPYNIFSPMCIAFGERTNINPFSYRSVTFDPTKKVFYTARNYFINKFVIIMEYTQRFAHTLDSGKKRKQFPGVRDLAAFEDLMRKMIIRRVKNEPKVQEEIKFPAPQFKHIDVTPDEAHIEFYQYFLNKFREWMREHVDISNIDDERKVSTLEILMQLLHLQFVSTIPQKFEQDEMVKWQGPALTAKQKKIIEIAGKHYQEGDKVIVFAEHPEFCEYMHSITSGFNGFLFTGKIPNKQREKILEEFKKSKKAILWATTKTGGTGLNIPEANVVIIAEPSWTPSDTKQSYSRILRPEQKKTPIVYFIRNEGMIEQYMRQLELYKHSAISEALDGQTDKMKINEYMDYADFAYKMLQDTGRFKIERSFEYQEV